MSDERHCPACGLTGDHETDCPVSLRAQLAATTSALVEAVKALEKAHACATHRDDGTCDGCFVSDALAACRPLLKGDQ